jgi:hypothetical protein
VKNLWVKKKYKKNKKNAIEKQNQKQKKNARKKTKTKLKKKTKQKNTEKKNEKNCQKKTLTTVNFLRVLVYYLINKTQLMWRFGSADELVDIELRFEWHFGAVTWSIDATPPMPHSERPHVSITQKMLLEDNLQVFPFSFFLRPKKENSKSKDKSNVSVMEMLLLSSSRSRERY